MKVVEYLLSELSSKTVIFVTHSKRLMARVNRSINLDDKVDSDGENN
jgi:ABC-type lipoprotein export system ATPase subunit